KSGIAGVRRLPVRNAERCSTISPLIGCNASGDAEHIRKTVNAGGLYAWVQHNPNFLRGACSLHHLSLAAKTLTLAAIALRQCTIPNVQATHRRSRTSSCAAAACSQPR